MPGLSVGPDNQRPSYFFVAAFSLVFSLTVWAGSTASDTAFSHSPRASLNFPRRSKRSPRCSWMVADVFVIPAASVR
jgi:hypothetical protein